MEKHYAGLDVGSDSVHAVVLDSNGKIVYSPESIMHFGNPVDALKDVYEEILAKFGDKIVTTAFTGSVGEFIAEKLKMPFFHDTIAIPAGVGIIAGDAAYVFHIGAKDPYFFEREKVKTGEDVRTFVPDHGTGTKCGGGSGILIAKQCRRFFENEFPIKLGEDRKENREKLQEQIIKMFKRTEEEIEKSDKDIDVGGRCGVVIQSDMIHLQNRGEQIKNILNGMFARIAKNYKSDVIKTRFLDNNKKAVATGGVFGDKFLVRMFEKEIGVKISVPEDYQKVGAIGAAIKAEDIEKKFGLEELDSIAESEKEKIKTAPALSSALSKVKIYDEEEAIVKNEDLVIYNNPENSVVLGVDGGSTTTKAIIADADNLNIVAEICLYTNGKPLQTAQEMFRQIRRYLKDIKIKGVAYTGSSGAFYYKLFTDLNKNPEKKCIDIVKDEITCHAFGVKHFNNKVDTIFELGGQDAKFTLFNKDGTVKKSKMNLSCMAGTGQTMHNMVEMLGLDIKTTFHEYALKAEKTPVIDETCGVFTEAGIAKLIAMGFPKEEIAAAIAFGFMGGYVNKFVGNEKFGEYASAQGGPFNGKSCLAALALHSGIEIHAFPHRQLFGALGAAIAVHKEIKKDGESKFRGLDIADMKFEKKIENCSIIVNDTCGVRDCKLQVYKIGDDVIYSGGLCPKGNTDAAVKRVPNYVDMYKKILNKHLDKYSKNLEEETEKERVLIPRSLTFLNEKGVFYARLYNELGFDVCISPESDDEIANLGINYAHTETCYPVKLAYGHGAYLKKHLRDKDKILLINAIGAEKKKYKFCPYVGGSGFLIKDALNMDNKDVLLPVIHFNDSDYKIEEFLLKDLNRVYDNRFKLEQVKEAVEKAEKAENEFLEQIHSTGERLVKGLKEKGKKIFMGIGRGYTILDDKASSKVHELFASYGLHFIPSFFLKVPDYNIEEVADNMYWYQGQSMIKYNIMTAMDDNLYAVRETNFNCGTDSLLLYHEEEIINKAKKPHLVLQTDGHNSNAQFGTRTLANYEVVKKHKPKESRFEDFKNKVPDAEMKNKIIGVPYMGDSSYTLAAAFRARGFKSEVMPTQTKKAQELARKFVSTNTCRPFCFQVGDHLAWLYELKERGIDPNKDAAVFEPQTKGPCRQGQYHVMIRKFLDENNFKKVSVVSPDCEVDYTNVPVSQLELARLSALFYKGSFCSDVLNDALLRTRPYEIEKGSSERLYDELREELYKLIEEGGKIKKLVKFMQDAKEKFEGLIDASKERKPFVVMNGEIFVRCHVKANQDSIKLLEKYGLEILLATPTQWLEYVNRESISNYKDQGDWKGYVGSVLKKKFIDNVHKKLYAPFDEFLKGRESHDPEHIINIAQKDLVYEKKVGGEAVLSISETYLFSKGDMENICGIYHVGPFGCMQETLATSKIQSLIQKQRLKANTMNEKIVPFMDAVFGESELPNLEAEIAAFAEKCYLKKELNPQPF
ncbi:MAG: BadF/BadG/BcrA/BcrD ATPase family protein [Candidatus Woesearchaeota archaeon]